MANEILTTLHPDQDPDTNLYPNVKKENIPSGSIDRNKLGDDVNSLLDNFYSLNPSGVDTSSNILSKTSDDGIWIGSDTGKWYYWDGSNYVEGGVYQATQIPDNSITIKKLTPQFRNTFRNLSIKNTYTYKIDIDTTDSYSNYNMVTFVADVGDTLVFKKSDISTKFNILATYDDETTGVLGGMYADLNNGITRSYLSVTLTKNIIGLGIYKPSGNTISCELEIIPNDYFNKNDINESLILVDDCTIYYDLIKCNYSIGDILVFNITGNENLRINILGVTDNNVNKMLLSKYTATNNVLILDDNIKSLGMYIPLGHTNNIKYSVKKIDKDVYKLSGLKYGALGDSITVGVSADNRSYAYYASKELYLNFTNYGISGNRIAVTSNYETTPMCIRYADMDDDLDIITIMGGTNDCASQVPIGNNDSLDNTTFKGALNILIKGLLDKYIGKKIGFITPTQRGQDLSLFPIPQEDYVNAMKEICALWSIPCLDLYHSGGITTKVGDHANGLLDNGDLHPTITGQLVLTNKVVEFIKSL